MKDSADRLFNEIHESREKAPKGREAGVARDADGARLLNATSPGPLTATQFSA